MSQVVDFNRVLKHTERPFVERAPASPFVKWAGGKRRLIPDLAKHFPDHVETYWEPFVGGGAVFFTMANRIDKAILSDMNEELVIAYQVVKSDVDSLIAELQKHQAKHGDDGYYLKVRAQEPQTPLGIAARFIYLNRTCYNGLYRVNKKGRFNVPKGRYKNPEICNEGRLRAASQALAKATIRLGDFDRVVRPSPDDFIYCDPPYDGCFTDYQAGGFTEADQERLRIAMDRWVDAGAGVLASNADTPTIRRIYRGGGKKYAIHEAEAPRLINSKASGRTNAAELIISSRG